MVYVPRARRENCEDPKVKVWLPPLTREGMYGTETKQLGYGHNPMATDDTQPKD